MSQPEHFLDRFKFREEYLASRRTKAEKILAVINQQEGRHDSLLDIGCGESRLAEVAASSFKWIVGIDFDRPGEKFQGGGTFLQADGCRLPFASKSFDVVVSNHIFEHVADPRALMAETFRVLRAGGFCYFSCPNRYSLVEPHYRLPFLSWLPRALADLYVRLMKRGDCYLDHPPSYSRLKRDTQAFVFEDKTIEVLNHPEIYFPRDMKLRTRSRLARMVPLFLQRMLLPLFPVWIVILRKPMATEY
jgi:ubiquinone/menaquinone biosynthesis C-methylase UbiE